MQFVGFDLSKDKFCLRVTLFFIASAHANQMCCPFTHALFHSCARSLSPKNTHVY